MIDVTSVVASEYSSINVGISPTLLATSLLHNDRPQNGLGFHHLKGAQNLAT
jgi:hypothetical protein